MFESLLCCWLLWCCKAFCLSCLLLLMNIICDVFIFVCCCLLKVGRSCPLLVECCLSLCCPVVIYSIPSWDICWFHNCCSFCCESGDVWTIICLLWNVEVMSWFDMYPFPQVSFSDPIVSCWWFWHWMWNWCWSSCSCWIKRWLLCCVSHPSCWVFGCLCWCWVGWCWNCRPGCRQWWHWWCVAGERCSSLNHVSPVQGSPPRILFCCLVSSVWYASSMFSVLPLLLLTIVLLKFSNLSVGTGHRWSDTKSAFRCVLCALTRYPWLLNVQRSFLFLRTSMPVGVKVTGVIFAVVPWVVWCTSSCMLTGMLTNSIVMK